MDHTAINGDGLLATRTDRSTPNAVRCVQIRVLPASAVSRPIRQRRARESSQAVCPDADRTYLRAVTGALRIRFERYVPGVDQVYSFL